MRYNTMRHVKKHKYAAFSLLEVAISLAIIGVLTMAVVNGQKILIKTRLEKTSKQIEALRINIESFRATYSALPGYYNGDALEKKDKDDIFENKVWAQLIESGLVTQAQTIPAIGGKFSIRHNPAADLQGHWILLSNSNETGLLTSKDALTLKMDLDGTPNNDEGFVRIRNGQGSADCVDGNNKTQNTKKKACIIYIEFP